MGDGLQVCVINNTMARRYWPDGAVGKRIRNSIDDDEWMLHILDNHKSHLDDVAIELLNNKKHFVQTLPKNTTHFMQVCNRPHKLTRRARAFALRVRFANVVLVLRFSPHSA